MYERGKQQKNRAIAVRFFYAFKRSVYFTSKVIFKLTLKSVTSPSVTLAL